MDKLKSDNKWAQIPEWVINLDISHTAFRLYAVLARYANNVTGEAFPARDTLADRLSCSVKTIDRAVLDLLEHGAIEKVNRGRYQSAIYTVITAVPMASSVSSEEPSVSSEQTNMSGREDKNDHITITTELEPSNVELPNIKEKPISPSQDGFDEWWDAYPLKKGKGKARDAYAKARRKVSAEKLQETVEVFRDDPNRGDTYWPHPTTWLNEERWDDESFPEPGQKARKMTNAEQGALLAAQYRAEEQGQLESAGARNLELESQWGSMVRGVDDE